MSKKWTAQEWVLEHNAALAAKANTAKLENELDEKRPKFAVSRGGRETRIAYVTDYGTLMMCGPELDLTPTETMQFRTWLADVFPCVPRPAEVVR